VSPVIIAAAAEDDHSADEQKSRINITSFICTEGRFLRRRDAVAAVEEHSADEQKSRVRIDVPSKNWGLGRSLAALFKPLLRRLRLGHKALGVASGVYAPLSTCSFGDTFALSSQRLSLPITYHKSKNGTVTRRRRSKECARFPADFAVTT